MSTISAQDLLFLGGPVMVPILICSIFALGIILNRWSYLTSLKNDTDLLRSRVFELLRNNKIKEAILLCEANHAPVARVLKAGLFKLDSSAEEIKEAMEQASALENPKLENGLAALITIANVAPLLGMFGTVLGITVTFHAVQTQSAGLTPLTPADLAGGIWQALLTTLAGLMVAIPSFVAYNFFVHRINNIITEMERTAAEMLNISTRLAEPADTEKMPGFTQ